MSSLYSSIGSVRRVATGWSALLLFTQDLGIESLQQSLPESELTQEKMLRPVQDFVPVKDSFAIIHVSGHQVIFLPSAYLLTLQYKVTEGDEIMVEKLEAPVLSQILLDKVLLVGTKYVSSHCQF